MVATGTSAFEFFGTAHVAAIVLSLAAPAFLSVLVGKIDSEKFTRAIRLLLIANLLITEFIYYADGLRTVEFDDFLRRFLPLHLCGAAVYLTAYVLWTRNQICYEIAFFLGIAGTFQAIITPELTDGFPAYNFVRYFLTHGGIVTGILFATWGMKMKPRFKGILYTFIITNIYMLFVGAINWMLGSNYMFLCHAPKTESPFFFTPWPWYILILEPIGIVLCLLLYLPFATANYLKHRRKAASD